MIKKLVVFPLFISLIFSFQPAIKAEDINTIQDSRELQYQDTLMLLLPIEHSIKEYYSKILTIDPTVYPYEIKVRQVQRVGGLRSFHFLYTLEVVPTVGPHLSVGKDYLVYEIEPTIPNSVKLIKFEHVKTYDLPPNWKHVIRQ
ncbi:hypothetical protein JOC77_003457 [Peribacillus deserti]|uniref:DUF3888 domain-containing protein n=1 Tax=Peribacillus deserti TaxID=673318 RepID=A0ABS2QNE7_9BACI|nr:DUF3888 domain-containing protein [Peribacillus deserti]MBM7694013.1 hypothetical protein [Peribacillus deserti]